MRLDAVFEARAHEHDRPGSVLPPSPSPALHALMLSLLLVSSLTLSIVCLLFDVSCSLVA